jgi:hypothetical protein
MGGSTQSKQRVVPRSQAGKEVDLRAKILSASRPPLDLHLTQWLQDKKLEARVRIEHKALL